MASSSTVPALSEMAELRAHGLGIPILFFFSEVDLHVFLLSTLASGFRLKRVRF